MKANRPIALKSSQLAAVKISSQHSIAAHVGGLCLGDLVIFFTTQIGSHYTLVGHVDSEGKALVALGLQHLDSLLVARRVDVPGHHPGTHLGKSEG